MKIGTEQKWQAARKQLLGVERELEEHAKRVEEQRSELPWVPVEKEYTFATDGGPKSLPERPCSACRSRRSTSSLRTRRVADGRVGAR